MEEQTGTVDFLKTYRDLQAEESRLTEQRTALELELGEVNTRLEHVKGALRHLSPLAGETFTETNNYGEDLSEFGITDAVRHVVRSAPKEGLTPGDVIKVLGERGFNLSKYSSPRASVHKILTRLIDAKDVERVKDESGQSPYKYLWIGEPDVPF
jgi:hypothetical protein